MNDSLGDRMKSYERTWQTSLPANSYVVLRVDGRAFHTLLRDADRPFDTHVALSMQYAAKALCREVSGAVFGYAQSDEISILLTDVSSIRSQMWFDGSVQKLVSVAASIATAEFNEQYTPAVGRAHFDARVFGLPYPVEVANYFLWRQRDAMRNAISMAAQAHFSQRELQGKNSNQMQEMLWSEREVNFNNYPAEFKRGSVVVRETYQYQDTQRHRWVSEPAPHFTAETGSWLADMIPAHDDWEIEIAEHDEKR